MELDHIALIVSSEECLDFYEKLGFKREHTRERAYDEVLFMERDGICLEIFVDPKHPERLSEPESKGLRHIAFAVDNLDEIAKLVECGPINTDWFGRRATFTKDYDGQPIELIEATVDVKNN